MKRSFHRDFKLFNRILLGFMAFLIFGLIAFFYGMKNKIVEDSKIHTIEMVQNIAIQKNLLLTNLINERYNYAEMIANLCSDDDFYNEETISKVIAAVDGSSLPYVFAFDKDGKALTADGTEFSVADRMYFKQVIEGKRTVSDVLSPLLETKMEEIIVVAVPILLPDNTVIGGIVCVYEIAALKAFLGDDLYEGIGQTVIIDKNERIIIGGMGYDAKADFFDGSIGGSAFMNSELADKVRQEIDKKKNSFIEFEKDSKQGIMVYQCNITLEWTVLTIVDAQALEIYSQDSTRSLLLILAASLIFAIVLFVIICVLYIQIIKILNDKRRRLEKEKNEFSEIAMRDMMTQLYNKKAATELIEDFLSGSGKNDKHALFFIDIDNFKTVNDNFGHEEGDRLIKNFASIITECFGSQDVAARFGGDEFIVFVKHFEAEKDLSRLVARLYDAIIKKNSDSPDYHFSASIGISVYPEHGTTSEELIQKADEALYVSKNTGKNKYTFYQQNKTAQWNFKNANDL